MSTVPQQQQQQQGASQHTIIKSEIDFQRLVSFQLEGFYQKKFLNFLKQLIILSDPVRSLLLKLFETLSNFI